MQIFYPSQWLMIFLFFAVWAVMQIGFSIIANRISDDRFDENSWFYKAHKWESGGRIYDRLLKVRIWKELLPDGAKAFGGGFEKKRLQNIDKRYLEKFIKETCRAEWTHWMQILPFWVFGLWAPVWVIWVMLVYALAVNLPCIIAQRFNRPRMAALLEAAKKQNEMSTKRF